jgi:hypothetical protein
MLKGQKHHYIPEFYLKQWAGHDGRLIEFCRRHRNLVVPRPTFPGGTGYVRGLYTIEDAPPHIADVFEDRFMSVADGIAAESLRVMLNDHLVPTGDQKIGWTRFMMSLLYRTPEGVARSLAMVKKYYEEKHLQDVRKVYTELKRPEDPETPEEYVAIIGARATSRTTIQHLMDIIESERVREKIMNMQWHLGRIAGLKHQLLTSDRPLVMTNGIALADSHIVMPLSPEHIFIAANTDEEVAKIKALSQTGELAVRLNDRVARQARKFVYAHDRSQLRFVANRLGQKMWCSPFES